MTRDEIIKLAHQAGFNREDHYAISGMLVRFAALVAAAEREACADIFDRNADRCDPHSLVFEALDSNAKAIRARSNHA